MATDQQTIAIYDDKIDDYANAFAKSGVDGALKRFMDELPAGGTVLDLGCGPGRHVALMQQHGFAVVATDASAAMVEHAQSTYGLDARQASFDDVTEVDRFDGSWANFSLLHAPRSSFADHLSRIATALKPGGVLHIAMKTGEGEARDELGRFYTFYTAEALRAHLVKAGFTPNEEVTGEAPGLAGTVDPWIEILALQTGR